MKTAWTSGLNKEKADEIRNDFQAAGVLRERLTTIVQKKIDSTNKDRVLKDSYETPSWPYLQADSNGYIRALEEIRSILE